MSNRGLKMYHILKHMLLFFEPKKKYCEIATSTNKHKNVERHI